MSSRARESMVSIRSRSGSIATRSPGMSPLPSPSPLSFGGAGGTSHPATGWGQVASTAIAAMLKTMYQDSLYNDVVFRVPRPRGAALDPSDVAVEVESEDHPCHKAIMIAASPVFSRLCSLWDSDDRVPVIDLDQCDTEVFRAIKKWIYLRDTSGISEEIQFRLRRAATGFLLNDLEAVVSGFIGRYLTTVPHACLFIAKVYDAGPDVLVENQDLVSFALTSICFEAEKLAEAEELPLLPFEAMRLLLSSDDFCATEKTAFRIFLRWCTESHPVPMPDSAAASSAPTSKEEMIDLLLGLVRVHMLPQDDMLHNLATHGLLSEVRADGLSLRWAASQRSGQPSYLVGGSRENRRKKGLVARVRRRSSRVFAGITTGASSVLTRMASLFKGRRRSSVKPIRPPSGSSLGRPTIEVEESLAVRPMRRSMTAVPSMSSAEARLLLPRKARASDPALRSSLSFEEDMRESSRGISFNSTELEDFAPPESLRMTPNEEEETGTPADDSVFDAGARAECVQLSTLVSWHYNFKGVLDPCFEALDSNQLSGLDPAVGRAIKAGGPPQSFRGTMLGNWEMSQPDGQPVAIAGVFVSAVRFVFQVISFSESVPLFLGICIQEGGASKRVLRTGIISTGHVSENGLVSADCDAVDQKWTNSSPAVFQSGSVVTYIYRAFDGVLDCFVDGVLVHQFAAHPSGWAYPMMQVFGTGHTLVELCSYQAIIHRDSAMTLVADALETSMVDSAEGHPVVSSEEAADGIEDPTPHD